MLGAVKTEFAKFGEVLAATKRTLQSAANNIEKAEVRSRAMAKQLKSVEALPAEAAQRLLGVEAREADAAEDYMPEDDMPEPRPDDAGTTG